MKLSIVYEDGRVVIPAFFPKRFGIRRGTKLAFSEWKGKLIIELKDRHYFGKHAGSLGTHVKLLRSLLRERKREREL